MRKLTALLIAAAAVVPVFTATANANDFPDRPWCGAKRVCVQWAPGAPGIFAGRCVKYAYKFSPYACKHTMPRF